MLSDDEFKQLLNYLDRPWSGFRKVRKGVKKRVRRHMESLGCGTIRDYLDYIENVAVERARCDLCLTVTISRFFRDRLLWEALQNRILPALSERFPEGLTAWSAGCANGEEPYSLAIIWAEIAAMAMGSRNLRILATDARLISLQRAEEGGYLKSSLKEVSAERLNRWFHKVGRGHWQVDAHLKKHICWQVFQLLDEPPPTRFHLILLRNNLLTYYQGKIMQTALENIIKRLVAGGVLIIGSHEKLPRLDIPLARDLNCPWVYYVGESFRNSGPD